MANHDFPQSTVSAGVSPMKTRHTGFVRRIPHRATGADTGDTHPSTAQAHSPPKSRLPPRVLGDLCTNYFLFRFCAVKSDAVYVVVVLRHRKEFKATDLSGLPSFLFLKRIFGLEVFFLRLGIINFITIIPVYYVLIY